MMSGSHLALLLKLKLTPLLSNKGTPPSSATHTVNMSSSLKIDLMASACADPIWGPLYSIFRNRDYMGSWYDADQMYWRIARDNASMHISELVAGEPTADAVTEALGYADTLIRAQREYHPHQRDGDYTFLDPTSIIKTWAPHAYDAALVEPAPAPAPAPVLATPPRDHGRPPRHPGAPARNRNNNHHNNNHHNNNHHNNRTDVRRTVIVAAPPPVVTKPAVKVPLNPFAALGDDDED